MPLNTFPEDFMAGLLPPQIASLDERGGLHAVLGGMQDRLEDLRAFVSGIQDIFDPAIGFTTSNQVLRVVYTTYYGKDAVRNLPLSYLPPGDELDIANSTTRTDTEETTVRAWAAGLLDVNTETIVSVSVVADELKQVGQPLVGLLADAVGMPLPPGGVNDPRTVELLRHHFELLRMKGTAKSMELVGKIMGLDAVSVKPLWGRVTPRSPRDVGAAINVDDFSTKPDHEPTPEVSSTYDPNDLRDGPFFEWIANLGKLASGTFLTSQNDNCPFVRVRLGGFLAPNFRGVWNTADTYDIGDVVTIDDNAYLSTAENTGRNPGLSGGPWTIILDPVAGTYTLTGGDYQQHASVAVNGLITIEALAPGAAFNGLKIVIGSVVDNLQTFSIYDRLSTRKYRTSYFDISLAVDESQYVQGNLRPVGPNADLSQSQTGLAPYRPFGGPIGVVPGSLVATTNVSGNRLYLRADDLQWYSMGLETDDGQAAITTPLLSFQPSGAATTIKIKADDGTIHTVSLIIDGSGHATVAVDQANDVGSAELVQLTSTDGNDYFLVADVDPGGFYFITSRPVGRAQLTPPVQELNLAPLATMATDAVSMLDYLKPATRYVRGVRFGLLYGDEAKLARYDSQTVMHVIGGLLNLTGQVVHGSLHMGTLPIGSFPTQQVRAALSIVRPDGLAYPMEAQESVRWPDSDHYEIDYAVTVDSTEARISINYGGSGQEIQWSIDLDRGFPNGGKVVALWEPRTTEVVRLEPRGLSNEYVLAIDGQSRPEDAVDEVGTLGSDIHSVADDNPWRRDLVFGGERLDTDLLSTRPPGVVTPVTRDVVACDQSGVSQKLQALDLFGLVTPNRPRLKTASGEGLNGVPAVATYSGKKYVVGLFYGVPILSPLTSVSKFRDNLVGWVPLNQHPEDDLDPKDHIPTVIGASNTSGIRPEHRVWDDNRGWVTTFKDHSTATISRSRPVTDTVTFSFWINPGLEIDDDGDDTIISYGPLSFVLDRQDTTGHANLSVKLEYGELTITVATLALVIGQMNFVYLRRSGSSVYVGLGGLPTSATASVESLGDGVPYDEHADDDIIIAHGGRDFQLHDIRIWNTQKSSGDMEEIRRPRLAAINAWNTTPVATTGRQEWWGLEGLVSGFVFTAATRSFSFVNEEDVFTYQDDGRFIGDDNRKEVGIGSGGTSPDMPWKLGINFYPITGDNLSPLSTTHGWLPGENPVWVEKTPTNGIIRAAGPYSSTGATISVTTAGGSIPWPNPQRNMNVLRDRLYVQGDVINDNDVYQVMIGGGSITPEYDIMPALKAGPLVRVIDTLTGEYLSVREVAPDSGSFEFYTSGSIAAAPFAPPMFVYRHSFLANDVSAASVVAGYDSLVGAAVLPAGGNLMWSPTGVLQPGRYRLDIDAGNIGRVADDFDGFHITIGVAQQVEAATVLVPLSSRTTQDNPRETISVEFDLLSASGSPWLLELTWAGQKDNVAHGISYTLAVYGITVHRLESTIWQVKGKDIDTTYRVDVTNRQGGSIAPYGSLQPGGWLMRINSQGSVVSDDINSYGFIHESLSYPTRSNQRSVISLTFDGGSIVTLAATEDHGCVIGSPITVTGAMPYDFSGDFLVSAIEGPRILSYVVPSRLVPTANVFNNRLYLRADNLQWYSMGLETTGGIVMLTTPVLGSQPSGATPTVKIQADDGTTHTISLVIDDASNATIAIDQSNVLDSGDLVELISTDSHGYYLVTRQDSGGFYFVTAVQIGSISATIDPDFKAILLSGVPMRHPMANILTATTGNRRDDILFSLSAGTITSKDPVIPAPPALNSPFVISSEGSITRFAAFGDYGINANANVNAVASMINQQPIDFILGLGDSDYNTPHDYDSSNTPYVDWVTDHLFFAIPGDHDEDQDQGLAYRNYFTLPGDEKYYDVRIGPVHIFCLRGGINSTGTVVNPSADNSVNSAQAIWLRTRMLASDAPHKIVAIHEALYTTNSVASSGPVSGVAFRDWPLARWGAKVVLSGHVHAMERIRDDATGLQYLTAGTGGDPLVILNEVSLPDGFTQLAGASQFGAYIVSATETSITFEFRKSDNTVLDTVTL